MIRERKRPFSIAWAPSNRTQNWVFGPLLLITVLAIFVPLTPGVKWSELDQSWAFGMNQAIAQGLVFGKDIVFTFGPYASIYTKTFHPATDHLMVGGGFYLGLSFFFVAFLNFRDSRWPVRWVLVAVLASIMYSRDALFFFYPLLVGIYLFKAVSFDGFQPSNRTNWYLLLIVLFFPLGLLPLIKGSALIACAGIVAFSGVLLLNERDWKSTVVVCSAPIVSTPLFWLLSGQPLTALPTYFISMAPIISGYTEAMGKEGPVKGLILYMMCALLLIWAVLFDVKAAVSKRIVAALMFFVVLFLAFKGGFVRHNDNHAALPATMIVLASLAAGTIALGKRTLLALIVAGAVWIYIDSTYKKTSTVKVIENVKKTYLGSWDGLKNRIWDQDKLHRDFENRVSELRLRGGIPRLVGTTDIYSFDQSYLIASGNEWNPRPILQSYSVYTPGLIERNKNHLLDDNRPDNIVFKVQPLDDRIPSLEDGASWPALLSKYRPAEFRNGYLILKHLPSEHDAPPDELTRISTQTHRFGEEIGMPYSDGLIFAQVNVEKTLIGRIWSALFKPSELEINLAMENGATQTYRFIAEMAKTGFLITPLVENTEEYGLLYAGPACLDHKKVKSIKIAPRGARAWWNAEFVVELFTVNYEANPAYLASYGFPRPLTADGFPITSEAGKCEGSIDAVNGTSPAPLHLQRTSYLR